MGKNFNFLNAVQFLDALNENLFKYIVVYFLIFYQGHESTSTIMSITGAVFILPFILFSSLGGVFADRWSKTKIIQVTRLLQILFMALALLFMVYHSGNFILRAESFLNFGSHHDGPSLNNPSPFPQKTKRLLGTPGLSSPILRQYGSPHDCLNLSHPEASKIQESLRAQYIYVILFVVTTLSALFGPSKYGILSEIVPKGQLLKANGYIAAFTFFGIIFGTALASLLDTVTDEAFPIMMSACIAISILGTIFSTLITRTNPVDPHKSWPSLIYQEIYDSLVEMAKIPYMLTAAFCYGYFLFIGAFVQMNIIPYSVLILGMKPAVGGYLFLFSSIGVGIGALIATKSSGKLASLPLSAIGMSVGCFLFTLFPFPFWVNAIWLIGLGIFGGLFLVPPQAFILSHSRPEIKGRNFGTANFFSFVFALLAAGVLYLFNTLLGISPRSSFSWIGILNLAVAGLLFFLTRQKKPF